MHAIGPYNPSPLLALLHFDSWGSGRVSSCLSLVHGWALVPLVISAKTPSCIMHELLSINIIIDIISKLCVCVLSLWACLA